MGQGAGGWREANWLPLEISCDMVDRDEAENQRWLGRPRLLRETVIVFK